MTTSNGSKEEKETRQPDKPQIVCLCGSTRFKEEFIKQNFLLTMQGKIVVTVGWFSHSDKKIYYPTDKEKEQLDLLHLSKIDLADEIFIINKDHYIGESTKRELTYAYRWCEGYPPGRNTPKKITFLEPDQFDPIQLFEFTHDLGEYRKELP